MKYGYLKTTATERTLVAGMSMYGEEQNKRQDLIVTWWPCMTETDAQPDETEIGPESKTGPENIYAGIQSGAVRITGVKIDYYHICHTKLWLFSHNITLDVSEIFKPVIVDRIILKLVNKNMLDDGCFRGEIGDMLLSEKGKKIFLAEYNAKLGTTIKHKGLKRNVSYKRLIRLELYKLAKHVLGDAEYNPLVMWW